jgi:hypothetical protein
MVRRFCLYVATTLLSLALGTQAQAGPINLDFELNTPTPSATFGAASGQVGVWNSVSSTTFHGSFVDVSGAALPGVALTITGSGGRSGRNGPGPADIDALLNDAIRMDTSPLQLLFTGLAAGLYDIYTYGLNSSAATDGGFVNVIGSADPAQHIGGLWAGSFVQGTQFALHRVSLGTGDPLTIHLTAELGQINARMAGLQIVPVAAPEPGLVLLLGIGATGVLRMRRIRPCR